MIMGVIFLSLWTTLIFCEVTVSEAIVSVNFTTMKKSTFYVDKTLFIKDFFKDKSKVKVITAPKRFGKSVIVDMLKLFTEINVQNQNTPYVNKWHEKYKIFCEPPLKICDNKTFVYENLGQYPVLHIDFNPLRTVTDLKSLQFQLGLVIQETFSQYKELSTNTSLFLTSKDKEEFIKTCDEIGSTSLNNEFIQRAFKWLSELLCKNFNRPVIVLVDDYDSFYISLLYSQFDQTDKDAMITFLRNVLSSLLQDNPYLDRALLTGIHQIDWLRVLPFNVVCYKFLDDHAFSLYFGFSEEEIARVVQLNVGYDDRSQSLETLKSWYSGYYVPEKNVTLYCILSTLGYIANGLVVDAYWVYLEHLATVLDKRLIFLFVKIMLRIFSNGCIYYDAFDPISTSVLEIFSTKTNKMDFMRADIEHWLYAYLYDIGFLSPTTKFKPKSMKGYTIYPLFFPSVEVKFECHSSLSACYEYLYPTCNVTDQKSLFEAVNMFKPGHNNEEGYKSFYLALSDVIQQSNVNISSREDLQFIITYFLREHWPLAWRLVADLRVKIDIRDTIFDDVPHALRGRSELMYFKKSPLSTGEKIPELDQLRSQQEEENNILKDTIDILCVNDNKVEVVFEINFQKEPFIEPSDPKYEMVYKKPFVPPKNSLHQMAEDGLVEILLWYHQFLNKSTITINHKEVPVKGRLYISIGFDEQSKSISMGFFSPTSKIEPKFIHNTDLKLCSFENIAEKISIIK